MASEKFGCINAKDPDLVVREVVNDCAVYRSCEGTRWADQKYLCEGCPSLKAT